MNKSTKLPLQSFNFHQENLVKFGEQASDRVVGKVTPKAALSVTQDK